MVAGCVREGTRCVDVIRPQLKACAGHTRWPMVPAPLRNPTSTVGAHSTTSNVLERVFLRSDLHPFRATVARETIDRQSGTNVNRFVEATEKTGRSGASYKA